MVQKKEKTLEKNVKESLAHSSDENVSKFLTFVLDIVKKKIEEDIKLEKMARKNPEIRKALKRGDLVILPSDQSDSKTEE